MIKSVTILLIKVKFPSPKYACANYSLVEIGQVVLEEIKNEKFTKMPTMKPKPVAMNKFKCDVFTSTYNGSSELKLTCLIHGMCPTEQKTENKKCFRNIYAPPWYKIQVYILCRSKACLKQVSKGLKYMKWTTHWAQKSGLTLTFEQVTWKSIGIIYFLGATPEPNLVLIKWRGQKIRSGQHCGLKRVVWP